MTGQASAVGTVRLPRVALHVRLSGILDRYCALHSPRNLISATMAVVSLCALASWCLGQDTNWDLLNYHFYNGYAFLHGRLALDLAPAQMQTYFAPLLDVVHYLMLRHWPAGLVGLVLGAVHGLLFLPMTGVAWEALHDHPRRARLAPVLAFAGLFSAAFLSELGNTMSDNTTALLVASSLWSLLRAQRLQREGRGMFAACALAGLLLGCAVAFKLTNAVYAVGLGAVSLTAGTFRQRITMAALLVFLALVACLGLAGYWWWALWKAFGNPLFPQFNAFFRAPLAQLISFADLRWMPHGWMEQLLWPLVFTLNPGRVGELSLRQLVWAALYVTAVALFIKRVVAGDVARRHFSGSMSPPMRVACFFFVAYLAWQFLFSIYRYLVVLEVLAPLMLWCGLCALLPGRLGGRVALLVVVVCAGVALPGLGRWGHAPWTSRAFSVQAPAMAKPPRSLVLLVGGEPQSWRIPLLPPEAAYASVGSNFPESPDYRMRLMAMATERPQIYVMLPAVSDRRQLKANQANQWAQRLGFDGALGCRMLRRMAAKRDGVEVLQESGGRCRLNVPADNTDAAQRDKQIVMHAAAVMPAYGLRLNVTSCTTLDARIGQGRYPYQWCRAAAAAGRAVR